jgi:hypothetical protein
MQCRDFREGISLFIDDEIAEKEKLEWERHRNECPRCAAFHDSLVHIDGLVRTIPDTSPAPVTHYEVLRGAGESGRAEGHRGPWVMRFAMACALMIICLGCFFYLCRGPILRALHLPGPGPSVAAVIDEPAVRYDVELNDSRYYVAVYGKEVSLLSFDMTENGASGISMSFVNKK